MKETKSACRANIADVGRAHQATRAFPALGVILARMTRVLIALSLLASCSSSDNPGPDRETLFDTGLCVDRACSQIASDALAYQPRFELWSNTASKHRWLQLPAGTKIDTTDMDLWVFPVGTKAWKEFTRDGVRVETRYIEKVLDNDNSLEAWSYAAYEWNAAQTEAVSVPEGSVNANGTMHDVPDNDACKTCHEQIRPSRLLGVEAIQLDFESPSMDLGDLIAMGLLSAPPSGTNPYFPLPGNATTHAAFGYLHANCSNCHSTTSYVRNDTTLDLRLLTTRLSSVTDTPTYQTTVNVPTFSDLAQGTIVRPRDPDNSVLLQLMNAADQLDRMPPVATELVDSQGQAVLRAWINSL
jgi:hypothetical protein